jgi:hypothetical protein
VPQPPIATDIYKPLDVHGYVPPEVALYRTIPVDILPQAAYLIFGKVPNPGIGVDPGGLKYPARKGTPDSVYIGQGDLHPFVPWQIYAGYTCHLFTSFSLALLLLVLGVLTDDHYPAVTLDDLTLFTNRLYRRPYLQGFPLRFRSYL